MKVTITRDTSCDMLSITTENGTKLFDGKSQLFLRDGDTFAKMFAKLGHKVEVMDKPYELWHDDGLHG